MNLPDVSDPVENEDPKRSCSRKAILWGRDDVLAHAMESFLAAREIWEVIRIFDTQGTGDLVEQAKRIQPEVVLLYPGNYAVDDSLPMQLIQNQPALKVVMVSLENNHMQVYEKNTLILQEAADLLSIIEERDFSNQSMKGEVYRPQTETLK